MSFCRNCGSEIPADGTFCPDCGTPVNKTQAEAVNAAEKVEPERSTAGNAGEGEHFISPKNRLCSLILACTLGTIGVHNFYLGNTSRAVAQLLLTIFGSVLSGIASALIYEYSGLSIFFNILAMGLMMVPTVTAIIDIVKIAKGTAVDGQYLQVKNWGIKSSSEKKAESEKESVPELNKKSVKNIVDKLFFLFPIVIGLIIMYTPARDYRELEYMGRYLYSIKYIDWSFILVFAIMAVGTFGFRFDFKKGIFMGLGASVGYLPVLKIGSFFSNSLIMYVLQGNLSNRNRYSYRYSSDLSYFMEEMLDYIKRALASKYIWGDYFKAVFIFFAVAVAMAFIAKFVRKYNEAFEK